MRSISAEVEGDGWVRGSPPSAELRVDVGGINRVTVFAQNESSPQLSSVRGTISVLNLEDPGYDLVLLPKQRREASHASPKPPVCLGSLLAIIQY
jgi:hypothetical protein